MSIWQEEQRALLPSDEDRRLSLTASAFHDHAHPFQQSLNTDANIAGSSNAHAAIGFDSSYWGDRTSSDHHAMAFHQAQNVPGFHAFQGNYDQLRQDSPLGGYLTPSETNASFQDTSRRHSAIDSSVAGDLPSFSHYATSMAGLPGFGLNDQQLLPPFADDSSSGKDDETNQFLQAQLQTQMQNDNPSSMFDLNSMAEASSFFLSWTEPETDDPYFDDADSQNQDADQPGGKKKVTRRQGVTCDQCRSKHLRCDLDDRRASVSDVSEHSTQERKLGPGSGINSVDQIKCSRCEEKGFQCTKTHTPPSRRYPRPSRTGKLIEQARMMHGSLGLAEAQKKAVISRTNASTILLNALTELRGADIRITDRVMAGSLSLQLINCFFATAHMQTPVLDFDHFSWVFNAANGDPRKMSIMSNGGSEEESLPSIRPTITDFEGTIWPDTKESKVGTPSTTETLIAVMHAWAAHFTDAPIAFGSEARELNAHISGLQEMDDFDNPVGGQPQGSDVKQTQCRTKRKQGVACDTCRLRRVRCDLTERPEGMGCSRCEDKKIKCTDEYIQTKRSKTAASGKAMTSNTSDPSGDAIDESSKHEAGESTSYGHTDKISPRHWITSKRETFKRTYIRGNIEFNLRRGKARKAFCHALLNHALSLVYKHGLLTKPSVEAAQALTLLAPLMDLVDGDRAFVIADTACAHLEALGITTKHVVNESDQTAVEGLLQAMQDTRLYLTTWCRDSISSGLNRRKPYFREDRAIDVISTVTIITTPNQPPQPQTTPKIGDVILSGDMGLSFIFMALMQIGALSRFIAVHIDRVDGTKPSIPPWQRPAGQSMAPGPLPERFAPCPTLAEVLKLEKACNAVWNSIDSLMIFFDRCAAKARHSMDKVKPFRPLTWIASTKVSGSLLYLTIFRVLGERHRTNAGYLATMTHGHGRGSISDEDKQVAAILQKLFDRGMHKTLVSCRRTARLVEVLLPLGILQTGGLLLKQVFPVAQFLSKVPSVPDEAAAAPDKEKNDMEVSTLNPAQNFIDPRSLGNKPEARSVISASPLHRTASNTSASSSGASSAPPPQTPHLDSLEVTESLVHKADLGPFTHSAKHREVDACVEGLSQLGYAWDTMDREIDAIRNIMDSLRI